MLLAMADAHGRARLIGRVELGRQSLGGAGRFESARGFYRPTFAARARGQSIRDWCRRSTAARNTFDRVFAATPCR